jgi:hypothetical protein
MGRGCEERSSDQGREQGAHSWHSTAQAGGRIVIFTFSVAAALCGAINAPIPSQSRPRPNSKIASMWKSQPPRTRVGLALRNLLYGALTSRRLRVADPQVGELDRSARVQPLSTGDFSLNKPSSRSSGGG